MTDEIKAAVEAAMLAYHPLLEAQIVKITQREINARITESAALHTDAESIEKVLKPKSRGLLDLPVDAAPVPVVPGPDGEVRPFKWLTANIQAEIDKQLAALPPDKKVAVIAHLDDLGPRLSLLVRVSDQWSVVAEGYKPWHGHIEGSANVRWTL